MSMRKVYIVECRFLRRRMSRPPLLLLQVIMIRAIIARVCLCLNPGGIIIFHDAIKYFFMIQLNLTETWG